jgi:hypothetical protein
LVQTAVRLLGEQAFLLSLAHELARDFDSFDSTVSLAELGFDDLDLLRLLAFIERHVPIGQTPEPIWEQTTLGDVYRLYALRTARV